MAEYYCHKCGTRWESEKSQPAFKEVCGKCSAYLHCCRNCRFHVPSAPNQCYIPNTEHVANREGLNYCEEFEFREGARDAAGNDTQRRKALDAFSGLFGDASEEDRKPSFDDLFKE